MKQGKVFYHPIEGSGQLSISWSSGPRGDAIEAKEGSGVGFFSCEGELISVIFDEVKSSEDHQVLAFSKYRIEVNVKNGKISFNVHKKIPFKNKIKRSTRKQGTSPSSKRKPCMNGKRTKKVR